VTSFRSFLFLAGSIIITMETSTVQTYQQAKPVKAQTAPLIQKELYFGRNIGLDGQVTEQQFQQFLNEVITPRFSNGLTIYNANGQFLDRSNTLIEEPSKVISIAVEDTPQNQRSLIEIIDLYKQQFQQESVLQVANKDIEIGNSQAPDLIENDPTPEWIQVDLHFKGVTKKQFRHFLDAEITSRFPNGLTAYNTQNSNQEPSQIVSLIFEDTEDNERSIYQIVDAYEQAYHHSVLTVVNEAIAVGFGQGEDVIDNDPMPEQIQVDLYFGRNIGTTGRVTETQFQQFLGQQITPLFPDGLTVYNARGQFLDSTQQLIREPSKVVSLIVEDTLQNERSINQIINAYKQQFQQESVLQVVDETIGVTFGESASIQGAYLWNKFSERNDCFSRPSLNTTPTLCTHY
jgi:Protein of unknown function (DUF3574)